MMYNPQLDTFLQVASLGSFSKAAESMFITAPAVIKQINLLEESLGVKLFVRTHRGLRLTEAGKSMYGDTKRIIQDCNEAVVRARNAMQDSENIVRIGTSPMTPGQFVLKLWPAIQEQCPDIKFQLVPFENTPQNARNILRNLGQNIDIVPGAFDQNFLQSRKCAGLELIQAPNRCENSNAVLMTIDPWAGIHPLLKVLPMDWDYKMSFGLLHSPKPSPAVCRLLDAFRAVY